MQLFRKYIRISGSNIFFTLQHSIGVIPRDNAEVGCGYLAYLIHRFGDSVYLGVYNWGETNLSNMKSFDDVPKHCKKYADSVLAMLDQYEETW